MIKNNIAKFIAIILVPIIVSTIFYNLRKTVISERNTLTTNSIPYKLNSIHYTVAEYSAGQKLYAQNSRNNVKSYYLNGKYTSNTDVMNFIDAVDRTASKARLFVNTIGITATVAIIGAFGIGGTITVYALIPILKTLLFAILVGSTVGITILYNDYVEARMQADYKFDQL